MLWVLIRIAAILMSTHNICFNGDITKVIPKLSSNTLLICSTGFRWVCNDKWQTNFPVNRKTHARRNCHSLGITITLHGDNCIHTSINVRKIKFIS